MENVQARRPYNRKRRLRQVYFIEAPELGRVKIGVATRVKKRLSNLQVGCPTPLILRGVMYTDDPHRLERGYHTNWAHLRMKGEWFRIDDELRAFMDEVPFEADQEKPPARILFHAKSPPTGRRAFASTISGWAQTGDEAAALVIADLIDQGFRFAA